MTLGHLERRDTPVEVAVLALLAAVLGTLCLAFAAHPLAPDAPRVLLVVVGVVAAALGAALLAAAARVRPPVLHAALLALTAMHCVLVASAVIEQGLMLSALGFVWTAVYAAYFFRAVVARAYASLLTVAFGASLLFARSPAGVSLWVAIAAMIWLTTVVIGALNARLRAEAHCDSLTGLLNRSGFALAAGLQRAMAERRDEPVTVAVIDLDEFKEVNDRDGHAAGDRLLADLAAAWTASLRQGDLLARFGGDEFVLLLPGIAEDQAGTVLARLRKAHPAPWTVGAVSCSAGESLDHAIDRADRRLYAAKGIAQPLVGGSPSVGMPGMAPSPRSAAAS